MIGFVEISEIVNWIIVEIFSEIMLASIDIFTFLFLFDIKVKTNQKIKAIIIDSIGRFLFICLVPVPFYGILNLIWSVLIFKFILKDKIERCIFGEIVNAIEIITLECIFAKIYCVLLPSVSTYFDIIHDYRNLSFLKHSIIVSRFIILLIIKLKKFVIDFDGCTEKKDRNTIIAISLIGGVIIYSNYVEMAIYITEFPYSIFLVDVVSLIVYFYISMQSVFRIIRLEKQDEKIDDLENYNKTLSIMYDGIRGFRHDFSNFVQALEGYANTNDISGIKQMSSSLTCECRNVNNMALLDPDIINNSAVYSLITNKYFIALENNLKINLEVLTNIDEIKMYSYEFCRILGILIDNAIEASKCTEEKIINIRIIKDLKINRKLVIIENSYNNLENINLDKIFEKGYTTKNNAQNDHGLGLWTVRRMLNKIEKLNLYTTTDEYFTQQIEIYN